MSHSLLTIYSVLVLHGLNLEIADAANKSGFNTRNQVALMDLIWAVRRIAFRHAVERPIIQRPPKNPIYPDRYRPGNASDNTNKTRKRGRGPKRQVTSNGTSDDPIDIEGDELGRDGSGTAANSSAKRLKVPAGVLGNYKVELPTRPKSLNPVHPAKFQTSFNKRQPHGRPATTTTTYMPSARTLNLPPPRPPSTGPVSNSPQPLAARPRDRTMVQLQKVGNTLQDNIDAVAECGNVMKAMYYKDDRLGDDIVYKELERLKAKFDGCLSDADVGIKTVEKIITLLEDNKEDLTGLMDQDL
jgi:hypothetical protein